MNTLGERLKYAIKLRRMKQIDLARKIGIAGASLSQFCSNVAKPSDRTLRDICSALDINEDWLRNGEGAIERETPDTFSAELEKAYDLSPYAARVINALAHAAASLKEDDFKNLTEIIINEMKKSAPAQDKAVQGERIEDAADIVDPEEGDQNTAG